MSAWMIAIGDDPHEQDVVDMHDGCSGYDGYCGGCDVCMYLQYVHWGVEVVPVHWVEQRRVAP